MGSQIASKNLYELLGNDPELDPDRAPEPPTKVIDKPVDRTGKRNGPAEGARASDRGRGGRGGQQTRADLTDARPAGNNRADQRDDGLRQDRHADRLRDPRQHREIGGRGRHDRGGRGTRGGRGRGDYATTRTARDDRHSHTGIGEHDKQAAHGWGSTTGEGEWGDERAGEAIAQAEAANESGFTPDTDGNDPAFSNGPDAPTSAEDAAPAEPEEKTKSYDEYLAEQAEKRLALSGGSAQEIRKANEGSKQKFPEGTAFSRNPEEENFIAGSGGKNRKQKEIKQKDMLNLEGNYYAPPEQERSGRGGRGGRGGFRGERGGRGGERGGRGRGGPRGEFRGSRGGDRGGAPRGGNVNTLDESAFPTLGSA